MCEAVVCVREEPRSAAANSVSASKEFGRRRAERAPFSVMELELSVGFFVADRY